jgi:hypothetical protein
MPYSRRAARLPRPSTRMRRRISAHLSMSANTPVPHVSGPRWSAGRPPSRARSAELGRGCDTFRPPVGYPAGRCPFSRPFRPERSKKRAIIVRHYPVFQERFESSVGPDRVEVRVDGDPPTGVEGPAEGGEGRRDRAGRRESGSNRIPPRHRGDASPPGQGVGRGPGGGNWRIRRRPTRELHRKYSITSSPGPPQRGRNN